MCKINFIFSFTFRMVTKHQFSGSADKPGREKNYYSAIETQSDAGKPANQHDAGITISQYVDPEFIVSCS